MLSAGAFKVVGCTIAFGSVAGTTGLAVTEVINSLETFKETTYTIKVGERQETRTITCKPGQKRYSALKLDVTQDQNKATLSCENKYEYWTPSTLTQSLGSDKGNLTCTYSKDSETHSFECANGQKKVTFEDSIPQETDAISLRVNQEESK
ncbi:hypothetical protein MHLP_02480 [Candidatus Mycoplasma haematolamae str. Purdue]|uniref:Uncharacterized protein n=1 Tax=Mycoplasma haematolamae (strain Purdue) TaxID=1212765 RepID=I7CFT1_MYCHA|nr:hypothetical protein [Candidatus Mycoplasma haematolamae]AFO52076.1 hypothetical protein MHLP_02480 [Candidatus Mycoplasma haematolamae str. Purdue]